MLDKIKTRLTQLPRPSEKVQKELGSKTGDPEYPSKPGRADIEFDTLEFDLSPNHLPAFAQDRKSADW